jgi:sialate O-acetylesterase
MYRNSVVFVALALCVSCCAELTLPKVFSDGMVLQRDQEVPVWGWADPGASVTVHFARQKQVVLADNDGNFMVQLAPLAVSLKPKSLRVTCGSESLEVKNVLVGDVWFCAGQSNMRMYVDESMDFDLEQSGANHPLIRMFVDKSLASATPQRNCSGSWKVCTPDNVGKFYATAYFFGRDIHKELNVPVGLIGAAWGGTPIAAWSPLHSVENFPTAMAIKKKYDEAAAGGSMKNPQNYPGNMFNARVYPWIPFGIRGAIWYQGEADSYAMDRALAYYDLLENMIAQWRKAWGAEFPFYAVQLANFRAPQVTPVEDTPWPFTREAFLRAQKEIPGVGMVVAIDVGEAGNIHPKNKQMVGYRLACQVLAKTYGKELVAGGPTYKSMTVDGNKIIIKFDDIGSGLVAQGGTMLKTFAIAGVDKRFVAAQAVIAGNTVVIRSDEIPEPVAVRYAWASNPAGCNLYNKEGFPASTFRTDNWSPAAE